jgi:hypothetical protein
MAAFLFNSLPFPGDNMPDEMKVHGLARVDFQDGRSDDEKVMILTDTMHRQVAFLINPEALSVLLPPALGLLAEWAMKPGISFDIPTGPAAALPAQSVAITPGRDETESAITLLVGKTQFSYLLPENQLMAAMGEFARFIQNRKINSEPIN